MFSNKACEGLNNNKFTFANRLSNEVIGVFWRTLNKYYDNEKIL